MKMSRICDIFVVNSGKYLKNEVLYILDENVFGPSTSSHFVGKNPSCGHICYLMLGSDIL